MREQDITRFSEERTVRVLRQIRDGFEELRKKGVIHRDLKLSNIFMHDDRVIIGTNLIPGDFGLAKTGKEMTGTRLGTPLTMAPEMIEGKNYCSKTDLWSIG
jgi:serine/threonine protein kinase